MQRSFYYMFMEGTYRVVVDCPTTHKEVDTGLAMSLSAFERPAARYVAVNCPHCGRRHEFHMDAAKLAIN